MLKYIILSFVIIFTLSCQQEETEKVTTETIFLNGSDQLNPSVMQVTAGPVSFWNLDKNHPLYKNNVVSQNIEYSKKEFKLDKISFEKYQIMEELLDGTGNILARGISGIIDINNLSKQPYPIHVMPVNKFTKIDNEFIGLEKGLTSLKGHTVTDLRNGKILIWGGFNTKSTSSPYSNKVYIYDPATQTVTEIDSEIPRAYHLAIPYYKDYKNKKEFRILITGGKNEGGFIKRAEIFNPETNSIEVLDPQDMSEGINQAAAFSIKSGFIYIFGGRLSNGYSDKVIFFNTIDKKFYPNTGIQLYASVENLTATYVSDSKIVLAGGNDADNVYKDIYIYDSDSNEMIKTSKYLSIPRTKHSAVSYNGKLIFVGGFSQHSGESFSGAIKNIEYAQIQKDSDLFVNYLGTLKESRGDASCAIIGNTMVVTGGYKDSDNKTPIDVVEIIKLKESFSKTDNNNIKLEGAKNGAKSILTSTGTITVIGGSSEQILSNDSLIKSIYIYPDGLNFN